MRERKGEGEKKRSGKKMRMPYKTILFKLIL